MADKYDQVLDAITDLTSSITEQTIAITKLEVQMSIVKWVGGVIGGAVILFLLGKVSNVAF